LRLRPDFDLGEETPPKILVVFKNVQTEERRLQEAMRDAEKKRLREGITVDVQAPPQAPGGRPLSITAKVQSRHGSIKGVSLKFRRDAGQDFATQPMPAVTDSVYQATFPAEQTATEVDRTWEYFVIVEGEQNEVLRSQGSAEAPMAMVVQKGSIPGTPLWQQPLLYVLTVPPVSGALLGAILLTGGVVAGATVALWLYSIQPPRGELGTQRL
jgi:hypothetical protein